MIGTQDLNQSALAAKTNPSLRQEFLMKQAAFVRKAASKTCGGFVTESDDAYSIALIAFNEAIDAYDETKGAFSSFAYLVIKRRLLDELRKDKKEIPVSPELFSGDKTVEDADGVEVSVMSKMHGLSAEEERTNDAAAAMRAEIEAAGKLLAVYGFSFFDLVDCSPKSQATRAACKDAIIALLRPGELYEQMRKSHLLPMKELEVKTGIKRKTLERHRKYIMAVAELLHGDFPHLGEYLREIRKGLDG